MAKAKKHSPKYDTVKYYYDHGLWDISRVHKAVEKGWITADEYTEITGEPYEQ